MRVLSKAQLGVQISNGSNETAGIHYSKKRSGHYAYKEEKKEVSKASNISQENNSTRLRFRT